MYLLEIKNAVLLLGFFDRLRQLTLSRFVAIHIRTTDVQLIEKEKDPCVDVVSLVCDLFHSGTSLLTLSKEKQLEPDFCPADSALP
jgi:hypothetical protein